MTSRYHGSKISGSQHYFGHTTTLLCIFGRWKKSIGYRFVPECNTARESHACHFFLVLSSFLPYLQEHGLLRTRNFTAMATRRNDGSSFYSETNDLTQD